MFRSEIWGNNYFYQFSLTKIPPSTSKMREWKSSLISNQALRLSSAKFFARKWDMRRVMKRLQQTKNIFCSVRIWSSNISTSAKFSHSETRLLSWVKWTFHEDQNFSQNGRPQLCQAQGKIDIHKTRSIDLGERCEWKSGFRFANEIFGNEKC